MPKHVKIFSDGSARGNPDGPGGYGAILQFTDSRGVLHEKELSEGFEKTTNNRMELLGVIVALECLRVNENWIGSWQRNGWKTASKQPVKNRELWERLLKAMEPHTVTYHWVKGHAGHPENERCDALATAAADAARKQ